MQTAGQRLVKNTTARLLNQIILVASAFVISVPLARGWGAELFGRYAFAVAFADLFVFSFDWGLHWLLTREVARDKGSVSRYLNNALGLTVVLSTVTMAALILLINAFDYPSETIQATYLAGFGAVLEVVASLFIRGTFYAFERMEYETPVLLVERGFAVLGAFVAVAAGGRLIALMWVLVVSRVLKLFTAMWIYRSRIGPLGLAFDWPFWRTLLRMTLPFGLTMALELLYSKSDISMLSFLRGDEAEIGYYRAALALVMYWPLVGQSLTASLFPMLSELYLSSREAFMRSYQRSLRWLYNLGLPMSLGLFLLGDRLVGLVYGDSFAPAVNSLRLLSGCVLLKLLHSSLAMVLTSSNRQALRVRIIATAVVVNVVLNVLLIPRAGHVGASAAALLTHGWLLVACYLVVSRQLGGLPSRSTLGPATLSAVVMSLGVLLFRRTLLLLLVPSAVIVYAVVLYALGGVPQEDMARAKALLPTRWRGRA